MRADRPQPGFRPIRIDEHKLEIVNFVSQTIVIDGVEYHMKDCDFPTVDPARPAALTPGERDVLEPRFDVIAIVGDAPHWQIEHLEDAFIPPVSPAYRRGPGKGF